MIKKLMALLSLVGAAIGAWKQLTADQKEKLTATTKRTVTNARRTIAKIAEPGAETSASSEDPEKPAQ